MKTSEHERVFIAQRYEKRYVERMEAIAKIIKSNTRAVIEMCLEGYLPELEKKFGIRHNGDDRPFERSLTPDRLDVVNAQGFST